MRLEVAFHADVLRLVTRSSPKNVCVRGYIRLDEAVVVVGKRQLVTVTNNFPRKISVVNIYGLHKATITLNLELF